MEITDRLKNCLLFFCFLFCRLNSTVSRAITESIPLYPQNRDISEFVRSMGNKPLLSLVSFNFSVSQFLVMKPDGLELITQRHILNTLVKFPSAENLTVTSIKGEPVHMVDRTTIIRDAIVQMEKFVCIYVGTLRSTLPVY